MCTMGKGLYKLDIDTSVTDLRFITTSKIN